MTRSVLRRPQPLRFDIDPQEFHDDQLPAAEQALFSAWAAQNKCVAH
jgi:hypothetical protein